MTKSRTLRRAGAVALSLAMAMSIVGVTPASAAAKKVTLSKAKGTIKVGKTATVKIKGTKKANVKKVTFKYSKKNIVKATWKKKTSLKFTVKGLKKGTSTVKATIQLKKKVGKKKKYTLKYVATVKKAAATPTAAPSAEPAGPTDLTGATQIVLSTDGTTLWVVTKDGKLVTVDLAKSNLTPDQIKAGGTFNLVDANGNAVTLTLTADEAAKIPSADKAPEVASSSVEMESVKQTKSDELVATFKEAVITSDVDITVKKGTSDVAVTTTWDATFKIATIKTASKMTKGVYTVTAQSKKDNTKKDSKDVQVDDAQQVKEIVIKNDVALTKSGDKKIAYAYYDVLDQFGESMRASTSIQWSGSATPTVNKSNGQIALKKNDGNDWVYGEKIYITGVYTKTGIAMSKELTIGTEQALDEVKMVGFVKKGTTEILQALPKDFKADTYYLVYNALDQNGNPLDAPASYANGVQVITFVSDNVLVVKEVANPVKTALVIEGTEYDAAFVEPGIKVADGGDVTVTAIANKTGKKTTMKFTVGVDSVIASFTIDAPAKTVADGDQNVEIPFEAKDAQGNKITDFTTIAKQETFNTLSFNASEGVLKLAEQKDGSAKLTWSDKAVAWSDSAATDGIDRPISLTAVVVGGGTDNEMISVSDKRRPDAIASVNLDEVLVEGATPTFTGYTSFRFYDQYGEKMWTTTDGKDNWGENNGFFADAEGGETLKGQDFAGYKFGVRATYAGTGRIAYNTGAALASTDKKSLIIKNGNAAIFETAIDIKSVVTGEGFNFEIVKDKNSSADPKEWEATSTKKFAGTSIVDITQVKNFAIGDLNTVYTGTLDATGDKIINSTKLSDLKTAATTVDDSTTDNGIYVGTAAGGYNQEIKVTGTYNGKTVTVPYNYVKVTANKLLADDSVTNAAGLHYNSFVAVRPYAAVDAPDGSEGKSGLQIADLYDKTTANGTAKVAEDEVKATIYKVYEDVPFFRAFNATKNEEVKFYVADYANANAAKTAANNTWSDPNKAAAKAAIVKPLMLETINGMLPTTAQISLADVDTFMATDFGNTPVATATGNLTAANNTLSEKQNNLDAASGTDKLTTEEKADADALWETQSGNKDTTDPTINGWDYTSVSSEATVVANAKAYLIAKRDVLAAQDAVTTAEANLLKAQKAAAKTAAGAVKTTEETDIDTWFADAVDENNGNPTGITDGGVYDTCKKAIKISDQAPYAADITGLAESYTIAPTLTTITAANVTTALAKVKVVDQYAVAHLDWSLIFTASNVEENKAAYAENNFKVSGNDSAALAIEGAERGDAFDLIVSSGSVKKTAKVTVGADALASIENDYNNYTKELKVELDKQRAAGLN